MDPKLTQRLSGDQITELGLPDWRSMHETLEARFRTGDMVAGRRFVDAIVDLAQELNHHPDRLDLHYGHLDIRLVSHDVRAKTRRDVELARRISAIAADQGLTADPSVVARVEIGLDTWDADEIRPFWMAVLGLGTHPRFTETVADVDGNAPTIWFQPCERHNEPRQRFHLDIRVPPEIAQQRVDAALAAGGTLMTREYEPRFTVLADRQGNKVCVCTHLTRED